MRLYNKNKIITKKVQKIKMIGSRSMS